MFIYQVFILHKIYKTKTILTTHGNRHKTNQTMTSFLMEMVGLIKSKSSKKRGH